MLDGSVLYGDAAGGMEQRLLLYYMAVTSSLPDEMSFALKYMKGRSRRARISSWPGPIARYYWTKSRLVTFVCTRPIKAPAGGNPAGGY
jgi:hypothetical protein